MTVTAGSGTVVGTSSSAPPPVPPSSSFDCVTASGAGVSAEVSLLAGVGTSAVMLVSEADTSALGQFAAAATDTGCPGGVGGGVLHSRPSLCPGELRGRRPQRDLPADRGRDQRRHLRVRRRCRHGVAAAAGGRVPHDLRQPDHAARRADDRLDGGRRVPRSTVTVSDAAATTRATGGRTRVSQSQTVGARGDPPRPAGLVRRTAGYGNVPAPFLAVNWFASGSRTAIAGSAAGISISDACYDGDDSLCPGAERDDPRRPRPSPTGTVTRRTSVRLTSLRFPSNDPNAATDCGTPLPGTSGWIDASFSYAAVAGTLQAALTSPAFRALSARR